jgi:hypothetical protein
MKKWLFGGAAVLLLFLLSCFFLIPAKIIVVRSVTAKANINGVYRFLESDSNWKKWWPEQYSTAVGPTVALPESGEFKFIKTKPGYNSFEIVIEKNGEAIPSLLHLVSHGNDSIKIEWSVTLQSNKNNPFSKISHYLDVRKLNRRLESILIAMQDHISQVKHVYGVDIRKEKIKLEFLVSRRIKISQYPTNEDIYGLISEIKKHLEQKQVKEEAYPIFNIEPTGNNDFLLLVAVPVSKPLADEGIFTTLKLLKGGDILVTEVNGGRVAVDFALKQIKIYTTDHQHLNVALPYQIFLTDRTKLADTSKWVTRINFPYI